MKKLLGLLLVFAGLTSCGLLDEIIPDIDTEYNEVFTIPISDNSGNTDPQLVDIASSREYDDFKNNIDGFEINEITIEVLSFDGPSDMFFSGEVLALDTTMSNKIVVGKIISANISQLVENDSVYSVETLVPGLEQVAVWLEDPGKFYAQTSYNLTNKEGDPYPLGDEEYSLELGLKYKVTVITVSGTKED
jgi:hypothetical protein